MSADENLLRDALRAVTSGETLTAQTMRSVVDALVRADLEQAPESLLAAGLLSALKVRGETVEEIVGAAQCLQDHQVSVSVGRPGQVLLDTCGTGGDGAHLINISTLAALVLASLGVKIAKHGNRSISSACGSADLLSELGYPLGDQPERVAENISRTGFGFLFAPHFHPAMRQLAGLRRALGVRTLFNLLGPLVNPAGVSHQLLGVYARELVEPMAEAAIRLGLRRVLVVHGEGGLDELSPNGTSWVTLAETGQPARSWEWTPAVFGTEPVALSALRGGDAVLNASILRELFAGGLPELASAVAMNVAAALWLTEVENDLKTGYQRAFSALRSGQVGQYFERCLSDVSAELS